jgi:hypothetical protein
MKRVWILACYLGMSATAVADPEGESSGTVQPEGPPRFYIAGGAEGVWVDSATMVGSYKLDGGMPVIGPLWARAHLARTTVFGDESNAEMDIHATELGGGLELRRCRWPWFVCGAVGVDAAAVIDDDGHLGTVLLPHLDGEIGLGNLALRLGLEGRFGREQGIGASTSIVVRF